MSKKNLRHGKAWNEHELDVLRKNFPNVGATRSCAAFWAKLLPGRTLKAINDRAYILGVRRDRSGFTQDDNELLLAFYDEYGSDVSQWDRVLSCHHTSDEILNQINALKGDANTDVDETEHACSDTEPDDNDTFNLVRYTVLNILNCEKGWKAFLVVDSLESPLLLPYAVARSLVDGLLLQMVSSMEIFESYFALHCLTVDEKSFDLVFRKD